ncbi:MAG: hypothetical protein N0C81_04680 [Candidatus Thiodiazotropha lotti]|uniref:Uncharacterized protein n=1 Tax=Candidatus Thiodiazotropha lotti TaxID=2792787 RepID=A0A9E4K6G6_9GAMM|nr:hypothetical protein [Candidatus Thiodiazotropha lotti]MCG8006931.1 hypothetical protein [Candidatus Thiodiazotropha lotti]MCW4194513.1 hypothetical protein [Candidatus Thiodiazotropha lotti]
MMMLKSRYLTTVVLGLGLIGSVHGDSILTFEMSGPNAAKETRTVSITGRWLRIDTDQQGSPDYTLMDTGRMLMFEVDDKKKSYKTTHMGKYYWPKDVKPRLKPMREKGVVAGKRCRKIHEVVGSKHALNHCMLPGTELGLDERSTKTLSRLYQLSRRMKLDWIGAMTPDERQISISSQDLKSGATLKFTSILHKGIPDNKFKIPDTYQRIKVEQKKYKH